MTKVTQPLSCLNFFYPSNQTYSDFERWCQEGNLSAIRRIEPIDKESIFLKGLFLCIEDQHLELFHFFIQHPVYQNFIVRHFKTLHQHLLEKRSIDLLQQLKNLNPNIEINPLIASSLEIAINNLFCFYHSQLSANHLQGHLQHIKAQITKLWQLNPPLYHQQTLPLSFDAYLKLQANLNENQINYINQIYLKHPLHICWRLFSHNENWFEHEHSQKQAMTIENRTWSIILFWLAAHDPLHLPQHVHLNFRLNYFFQRLAQMPTNPNILDFYLIRSVIAHPFCQLLDQEILSLEFQNFSLHAKELSSINFLSFHDYMSQKWKHQWFNNIELQQFAKQALLKFQEKPEQLKLGFFYNETIQSKSPNTIDFLVPLS